MRRSPSCPMPLSAMILASPSAPSVTDAAPQAALRRLGPARVQLAGVAAYLPETVRTSRDVEARIAAESPAVRVRPGIIAARTGIHARRVAAEHEQCSDLAVKAARAALAQAGLEAHEVELLIFAAASQDLIEPATAHIVQHKLGTRCQVLDVKNACNSFLNGVQVAESLLCTGAATNALVVTGEICSRAVRWHVRDAEEMRRFFPGWTMGDAGAAVVLTAATHEDRGIRHRAFAARSAYWPLATIPYGGSMHPRGDEYAYLHGDGPALKDAFVREGPAILHAMLRDAGVTFDDVDHIFVHQVGEAYHAALLAATGMPAHKVRGTVAELGNMASATLPVAHARAVADGTVQPGDRVLWLGMASGISVGVFIIDV
jgi:acyl-CoA:acyl-CoA alkyltransferase